MIKLKTLSCLIVASLFTISHAHGEGSEGENFSLFSLFQSETPLQAALAYSQETLPNVVLFYEKMNYQPVWFSKGRLTQQGRIAIEVLQNAEHEGLHAGDYADAAQMTDQPESWIDAEILLTTRFLEFVDHLRTGRIDPMKISCDIKFHNCKTHAVELLIAALQDGSGDGNKLRLMAPSLPQYAELKRILADYRKQAEDIKEWPRLLNSNVLTVGDSDPDVVILRKILVLHGDLEKPLENSLENFLGKANEGGEIFDAAVDKAVREFQKRYSLEPDGSVGDKTREALNYPVKERIHKVIVNMERLRWLPDELGHKHIIVNVAGYVLHGFEDSEATIMMPIIVGRPDRRTPLFYTKLKNIVLNPSWGVPHSIFVHDKLPKILHDPNYVRRSNFTVMDQNGNVIDPDAADWLKEGKNYYLRQSPGSHNALGRIKFNIENPYTVYLHGTPDQHLFAKKARAFSSGCIRLKHPLKLAVWILNNDPLWSSETIEAVINTGETHSVKPIEYVPVYFTYQSIWVKENEKGKRIFFSNDPYKLDMKMTKVLRLKP